MQHHHHHWHIADFLKKNIYALYTMHLLDRFVFALVGVFVPIYLLTLGYGLERVLQFYIAFFLIVIGATFFSFYLARRIGVKRTIFWHIPLALIFLYSLRALPDQPWLFWIIPFLAAFQATMYWMPLHSLFSRHSHRHSMGSDVSGLMMSQRLGAMFAPIIGGLIGAVLGFGALFLFAMLLLCTSILPLLLMPDVRPQMSLRPRRLLHVARKYPRQNLWFLAEGAANVGEMVVWPLMVFIIFTDLVAVGFMRALMDVGILVFTFLIGRIANRLDARFLMRLGAIMMAILWFARGQSTSTYSVSILTILAGFFLLMVTVPVMSSMYRLARDGLHEEAVILREVLLNTGRIAVLVISLFLIAGFGKTTGVLSASYFLFLIP